MCSERTGKIIATSRAEIAWLQHIKKNELRPQLQALLQLYYSMNESKRFNEKSYENHMLQRQIRFIKNQLTAINNDLAILQEQLREFLREKDKFYQRVRVRRKHQQVQNNQSE